MFPKSIHHVFSQTERDTGVFIHVWVPLYYINPILLSTTCTHNGDTMVTMFPAVDIRRLTLPGGAAVSVVVRAGEPHLLKVELPAILPSHSRDVLETIRRVSVGLTVQCVV